MNKNIIIEAPHVLCIYREMYMYDTYKMLSDINRTYDESNRNITVIIDLSEIKTITAAAALLLFATINSLQISAINPNKFMFKFPKLKDNITGYNCIMRSGLSKSLLASTHHKREELINNNNPFQTAIDPESHRISTYNMLTKEALLSSDKLYILMTAISEAMLNVNNHAYKNIDPQKTQEIHPTLKNFVKSVGGERWWQCAWHNPIKKSWVFIICDLGLGITTTYNSITKNNFLSISPASCLSEAFTQGKSRFINSGRGNGSQDIINAVKCGCKETLLVYSGGAKYSFSSETGETRCVNLGSHFKGTLIEWTLNEID